MNLDKDLFFTRNYIVKRKPKIRFDGLRTQQKLYYPNINKIKIRYSKRPKEIFLDKINAINNGRIINNIITPSEKSYFTESNQSQINGGDIFGYNNYIINKNSFNTINFTSKKNMNQKTESISNFNYADTPNYITAYESSSNLKLNNTNNNQGQYQTTNPNNNSNLFSNNDIKYMNMKLNFKILQKKLSHLNDIATTNFKVSYKTPYKMHINTTSGYSTELSNKNYPIKVFRSELINNTYKLKKILKDKKNKDDIYQMIDRQNVLINNNMKIMNNNILRQNILNKNKNRNETDLFKNKIINNRYKNYIKDRYYTNENSLSKHYKKEESELSQIADNILELNKSSENLENNYFIKDKSFEIQDFKSKINGLKKNDDIKIKNKNKKNQFKFFSNDFEEISLNNGYNQTQNNNNQNFKLIVEHIFSYNSTENKKSITEQNSDNGKSNRRNKNNKNINIVQTNNFILNNLTEHSKNRREERPKIDNNYTDINLRNENTINNKIKKEDFNDDEGNDEDDGDKIINSLLATASHNFKHEKEIINNNSITDFHKIIMKDNSTNKKNKNPVTFDDNLIYINYHQNYKVTNLQITDNNNKTIKFRPIDISKYLKKLVSNNEQLKPIITNSNKTSYINIINKIKLKNTNSKINKTKANQIIKRNIEFIKEVEKRNNSKEKNQRKDKNNKKYEQSNNSINIKVNKSNNNNNKIIVNKK